MKAKNAPIYNVACTPYSLFNYSQYLQSTDTPPVVVNWPMLCKPRLTLIISCIEQYVMFNSRYSCISHLLILPWHSRSPACCEFPIAYRPFADSDTQRIYDWSHQRPITPSSVNSALMFKIRAHCTLARTPSYCTGGNMDG